MTEFERNWTHTEHEQHTRLLYQLKREIVAKRQAEQAQAKLQRTVQSPQEAIGASLSSVATPIKSARPSKNVQLRTKSRSSAASGDKVLG